MNNSRLRRNQYGNTIIEVLIASLITGILVTATISFYMKMQEQTEHQYDVSEMHQLCRTSLQDIRSNLMQAGFKTNSHPPYTVMGDSLAVFYSETQPIDTVLYYLEEFTTAEYDSIPDLPVGHQLYKLFKKVNSGDPSIYADYLTGINYNQVDSANMVITITVHSLRKDDSYQPNDGFRTYSLTERVNIRNVG